MKRDMELVRRILIRAEEGTLDSRGWIKLEDLHEDEAVIWEHVRLLKEAGYVEAIDLRTQDDSEFALQRLNWEGHEFLAAARNDSVWRKALDKLKAEATSVPLQLMQELLMKLLRDQVLGSS